MTEEQRLLVTRIKHGTTEDGKVVIELYEDNPKLRFPSLRLFDPSKLFAVGVDPNELEPGEERFVRFYAWYLESDRLNGQGNRYKDVTRLEAVESDQDSQALQNKLDMIVELLVNIEHHLAKMANPMYTVNASGDAEMIDPQNGRRGQRPERPAPAPPARTSPPQAQPKPERVEKKEPDAEPVLDEDMARKRFATLAGPAIRDGSVDPTVPGKLTAQIAAKAISWRDALQGLEEAISKGASV